MSWPGWEDYAPQPQAAAKPKRSKYSAEPTEVDGHRFASQKEARRYQELKLLSEAGEIRNLLLQPRFGLCPWRPDHSDLLTVALYVADFQYYTRDGERVIEDAKGVRTPVYKLKKAWFEAQYGIEIREV